MADQQALQQQLYMQQQQQLEQEYLMQQQQQAQQQQLEQDYLMQQQQQQQVYEQQGFAQQPQLGLFGAPMLQMPQVPNSYVNPVQPAMDGGFQIGIPGGFQFYQEPQYMQEQEPAGAYGAEDVYGGDVYGGYDDIVTRDAKAVAKKKKSNWCGCF